MYRYLDCFRKLPCPSRCFFLLRTQHPFQGFCKSAKISLTTISDRQQRAEPDFQRKILTKIKIGPPLIVEPFECANCSAFSRGNTKKNTLKF